MKKLIILFVISSSLTSCFKKEIIEQPEESDTTIQIIDSIANINDSKIDSSDFIQDSSAILR